MKTPFIIITAPHSKCNENIKERHCDRVAKIAANYLYNKINYPKILLLGDEYRYDIDLNRNESINQTKFWRSLKELIKKLKYNGWDNIFILDIHSFPPDISNDEIFIIDNSNNSNYIISLVNYLNDNYIKTDIYNGTDINAIVINGIKNGIKSLLIEFNEKLTNSRIDYMTDIINRWIIKYINET